MPELVKDWLAAHPDATVEQARAEVEAGWAAKVEALAEDVDHTLSPTSRQQNIVRALADAHHDEANAKALALEVVRVHRPTHGTAAPDVWNCGEVWCHQPWPCLPFRLAEVIALGGDGA